MLLGGTQHVVVVGVLAHPAVDQRPGEPVDGVLGRGHVLHRHFRVQRVRDHVLEGALQQNGLAQDLQEVGFFGRVAENVGLGHCAWPGRSAQHLEELGRGVGDVALLRVLEAHRVQQQHQVRRHLVQRPAQLRSHHQRAHDALLEQREHTLLQLASHRAVQVADSPTQTMQQRGLRRHEAEALEQLGHLLLAAAHEQLGLAITGGQPYQLQRG